MKIAQLAELLLEFRRDFNDRFARLEKKLDHFSQKTAIKFADIEEKMADFPTRAEFHTFRDMTVTNFDHQTRLILGLQAEVTSVIHRQDRFEAEFVRR
jgi:hypothetical protein